MAIWRDADKDPPKQRGFYFSHHPRWGKVVMGWAEGWGEYPPRIWLDEDGLVNEEPTPDCVAILHRTAGIKSC